MKVIEINTLQELERFSREEMGQDAPLPPEVADLLEVYKDTSFGCQQPHTDAIIRSIVRASYPTRVYQKFKASTKYECGCSIPGSQHTLVAHRGEVYYIAAIGKTLSEQILLNNKGDVKEAEHSITFEVADEDQINKFWSSAKPSLLAAAQKYL